MPVFTELPEYPEFPVFPEFPKFSPSRVFSVNGSVPLHAVVLPPAGSGRPPRPGVPRGGIVTRIYCIATQAFVELVEERPMSEG